MRSQSRRSSMRYPSSNSPNLKSLVPLRSSTVTPARNSSSGSLLTLRYTRKPNRKCQSSRGPDHETLAPTTGANSLFTHLRRPRYMKSLKGKCFSDPIWDRYKRVYGDQNPDSYEFARQYIKELRAAPLTAATVRCGDVKACAGGDVSVVIQGPADSRDRFAYCGPIRNRHIVVCEPFWTLAETHNVKRGARILSMEWMRHKRSANGAGRKT